MLETEIQSSLFWEYTVGEKVLGEVESIIDLKEPCEELRQDGFPVKVRLVQILTKECLGNVREWKEYGNWCPWVEFRMAHRTMLFGG